MPQDKPAREQNPLAWLFGSKETPEQKKAREDREAKDKATQAGIRQAIAGFPALKKVAKDTQAVADAQKKK
jgi:hypothetical protein